MYHKTQSFSNSEQKFADISESDSQSNLSTMSTSDLSSKGLSNVRDRPRLDILLDKAAKTDPRYF